MEISSKIMLYTKYRETMVMRKPAAARQRKENGVSGMNLKRKKTYRAHM